MSNPNFTLLFTYANKKYIIPERHKHHLAPKLEISDFQNGI